MKKTIITFLASVLIMPCLAEKVPTLLIKTAETAQEVGLADISKVTYTETDMVVVMKDGSTKSFPMDDITGMTFTNSSLTPSSINATMAEMKDKEVIYTIDGIRTGNTDKKGIYIIKVGKETRKVAR